MCKKHREQLSDDPKAATALWSSLMFVARHQANTKAWGKSIISYGNALDAAQVVFERDPRSPEVSRYIRTASELAFTIRQCNHPIDIQRIVAVVTDNLEKSLYPASVQLLLHPLTEIAYCPLSEVNQWVRALFEADIYAQNYSSH